MKKVRFLLTLFAMFMGLSPAWADRDVNQLQFGKQIIEVTSDETITFYDSKGTGGYSSSSDNAQSLTVFKPAETGKVISITFEQFDIRNDGANFPAQVWIYNGTPDKDDSFTYATKAGDVTATISLPSGDVIDKLDGSDYSGLEYQSTDNDGSISVGLFWKYAKSTSGWKAIVRSVTPDNSYKFKFNSAISTSYNGFSVGSNWGHLVDYDANYDNHMSYSYSATGGVGGSGALLANQQKQYNYMQEASGVETYDLIITPIVSGKVTLDVKKDNSNGYIQFYHVTGNAGAFVRGEEIQATGIEDLSETAYSTITMTVDANTRIGIRASQVYLDNFTAEEVTLLPESKITIVSAEPSATNGTIYWEQQPNKNVLVKYTVTVKNNGEVDLKAGDANYSVSIVNRTTGKVLVTTNVPQDLAIGETSAPFDVQVEIPASSWENSYTYIHMDLQENLMGTSIQRAQSHYTAYEPKFVFREAGSDASSSITTAEAWGTIRESKTKSFEISNTGIAPLIIKSIELPEGFTSDNIPAIPSEGLIIAKGGKQTFSITQTAAEFGKFAGTLTIVYLDKDNAEQTYTLAFSTTVIGANTWSAEFNNTTSTPIYPAGSIAESGINSDYTYNSGKYDICLKGRTGSSYATENNKFITPKLHASAGQQLTFDVKGAYGDSYYAKVYVSTDRKTWGEPVATFTYGEKEGAEAIGSSDWVNKAITFDTEGDYYVAFALYGEFKIDNIIGLTKVDVAHDLYIKSVNWPDASIKSGTSQSKPSVDIIPLTDEVAGNYTVKYIYGENVVNIDSKALTSSPSSTTTFTASFTPTVETTTTFPGSKIVFEFTDGTKFETEGFDLTVTNEAIFHFLNDKPSSKWYEPTDRTAPITFGKVNKEKEQSFIIFNWGSAPLTVNSIALPDGFSTTTEFPLTVAAFNGENSGIDAACQSIAITFSATEANTYSGDMVITYSGDKTFTLPISGTMLDPTKFYANFDDQTWPAGTIYQDNVSISYINTGDYGLLSSNATKNFFITPKLTATDGEVLQFDASTRNSNYDGTVKVYISSDRDTWGEPVKEIALSKTENTSKATYDYKFTTAGDYYVAFELNEARVDDIYGLTPTAVAHDWKIASSNIPTEAMQNVASIATINLQNFGLADEEADSYIITAYVNDKVAGTGSAVAIPMNHKLSDAGTQLLVNFLYPKTGTYKVYLEVKAGDYSVATEPVDVTFAEEVAVANAIAVGNKSGNNASNAIIDFYNFEQARTSDILYTAAQLNAFGIIAGSKINKLAFRATPTSTKTIESSLTAWVGLSTGDITPNSPDKSVMTEVTVFDGTIAAENGNVLEVPINLSEPIIYDGTSDIRIYFEGGGDGKWISLPFDYDNNYPNMKWSNNSSIKANPLLYVTLATESATLSGTVKTSADAAIAGATITLKAANGVEYTGTTDADGVYNINVIQAGLDFTITVEAEDYEDQQFDYSLDGSSKILDIKFYPELILNNSEEEVSSYIGKADVTVARTLKDGWNAIVLPFTLTADDITNAFGADAEVATFAGDEQNDDNVHVEFAKAETVAAGVPFLLYLKTAPVSDPVFNNKAVNFTVNNAEGNVFDFVGTFTDTTADAGDYILSGGIFKNAKGGNAINAYRAYLKLKGTATSRVSLFIDGILVDNEATAITGAKMNAQQENVYSLSGQKINNQLKKGIYIINGKKVVIK